MKQTKPIITNLLFAIQILLVFLLVFEKQLQVPIWLQPVGRMHPLLLHLPIGFLVLLVLLPLLKREILAENLQKIQLFTLHLAALTASLTALMGLFLAQEEGYDTDLVNWHKWWGVGVSFVTYGLLLWQSRFPKQQQLFNIISVLNVLLLIITGHLGASITHGEDYILKPIRKEKPIVATLETPLFIAAIQPILEKKCYTCHNESKAKGKLIMTSLEQLLKGGKHGALWLAGNSDSSLMIQRIKLPLEHDHHMPPKEKIQLTAQEIQLIQAWIQAGANVKLPLKDLQPTDTLYHLVNAAIQKPQNLTDSIKHYTFNAISEKKLKALNNPFCAVYPVALGSPALHAEIFVRQAYQPAFLQDLTAVREQLISLDLTNMPIRDEDLKIIAKFQSLEKLILNGTNITGQNLMELNVLKKLQSLSLSNTGIDKAKVQVVKDFPALHHVYVWNTRISSEDLQTLQKTIPKIQFDGGYVIKKAEVLQLSPPLLKNKSTVLAADELVTLENKFPGVTTRYTLDGSEPDSLSSPIYKEPFPLTKYTILKVKNWKDNWKSSVIKTYTLFPKGQQATRVALRTTSEPAIYKTSGVLALYDNKKGNPDNAQTSLWLGFKEQPLDAYFYFGEKPPVVREVTVSIGENLGYRAFPPAKIEVWGGADTTMMQRLTTLSPPQPKDYEPNKVIGIRVPIPVSSFPCYRIVVQPLTHLPAWHGEKVYGPRILVDEVFFY